MADVDVVIVGGGALGLACAARLAARGESVVLLERNARLAQETSSRNSGVVHAGLYYPSGSWKARLCTQGRALLYARARRESIPHRQLGKLVVACNPAEVPKLESMHAQGQANGTLGLRMLDRREALALEPNLRALAALYSPETGIVDAHALVASYRSQASAHGAQLILHTLVTAIERQPDGYRVVARAPDAQTHSIVARRVVNAAGLFASQLARLAGVPIDQLGYTQHFCKGAYFQLAPRLRGLVKHLVYPLPVSAGLGIHLTLDMGGTLRAGPDAHYVSAPAYDVDPSQRALFGAALRRYVPQVQDDDLTPDFAGVRPKLQAPGEGFRDFVIEEASAHGLPGLVNLLGIESPGLTASEAIALRVAELLPK